MKTYFETRSAVVVALLRDNGGKKQILLQRRQNTGFADGLWDLSCAGHVEKDESMTVAAVREAKEELGVDIQQRNLEFMCLVHKRDKAFDLTYYNGYFLCDKFLGAPTICEKEKCSSLTWFDLDDLPVELIDDRKKALEAWGKQIKYVEYGWNNEN